MELDMTEELKDNDYDDDLENVTRKILHMDSILVSTPTDLRDTSEMNACATFDGWLARSMIRTRRGTV